MLKQLPLQNSQFLSYAEYGPSDGFPILIQHGMIASIQDGALFESLFPLGFRVICLARPGYGQSSPKELKNVATWGEIVETLADHLNLPQFDVFGISSGAPYAYAIAHRLPKRVRNVYILSGTPALYDPAVAAFWPFPLTPQSSLKEMQQVAAQVFFSNLSPDDQKNADIIDSMQNDCFGPGLDLKIRCLDWGFRLEEICTPVWMRHFTADPAVPFAAAALTAGYLPNCTFDAQEKTAHFSLDLLNNFIQTIIHQQEK